MNRLSLAFFGALLIGIVTAGSAAAQADPFTGTWKVDLAKSQALIGQLPKEEILTIAVKDGAEHAINDITGNDGVRRKSEYTAKYNDGQWYPTKDVETGKPGSGMVMMIRADPRTELRIGKGGSGRFGGVIMRQLSEDGKTMTITWGNPDGKISQILHLNKQ